MDSSLFVAVLCIAVLFCYAAETTVLSVRLPLHGLLFTGMVHDAVGMSYMPLVGMS